MDPASATSLAAAILQLANYTGKVLSRSAEIWRREEGALSWLSELSLVTESFKEKLVELAKAQVHDENSEYNGSKSSKSNDDHLRQLGTQAQEATQELLDLLQELSSDTKSHSKWRNLRQAVIIVWNESKLRDLEERVARYRSQIDSVLLHHISSYVVKVQDRQREGMNEVSSYADIITPKLRRSNKFTHKSLYELTGNSSQGLEVPQDFATNLLALACEPQEDREQRHLRLEKQLLNALDSPELSARHGAIPTAYTQTFNWAFRKPEESGYTWSDYTQWLQGDEDMYWIAGKPGAGKSTLMKYLFDDTRTLELANVWAKDGLLQKAGFFFWNSGTKIQMSGSGLALSLLKQLHPRASSMKSLFPRRWHRCDLFGWTSESFTWEEVVSALDTRLSEPRDKFLLFIDGLDEFDGDKDELVNYVMKTASRKNVKICTASRPWVEFQSRFHDVPQLLIERLTRHDMVIYVEGKFSESRHFCAMRKYEAKAAEKLIVSVIDKACGVFLWVYVVVTALLQGCRNGDGMKDLLNTLNSIPPELDDMFGKILRQIEPKYAQECSEFFQFVRDKPNQATLASLQWSRLTLEEVLSAEIRLYSEDEAKYYADKMKRNLFSRCKCLLDVPLHADCSPTAPVTWLHRTAREYCEQKDVWANIRNHSLTYNPARALTFSLLRQAKAGVTSTGKKWRDIQEHLIQAILCCPALSTEKEQLLFLDQVEDTGASLKAQFLSEGDDRASEPYWMDAASLIRLGDWRPAGARTITLFHAALACQWTWYVEHRLSKAPEWMYRPTSAVSTCDALELAISEGRWDVLGLCLRFAGQSNYYRHLSRAWISFLDKVEKEILQGDPSRIVSSPTKEEAFRCARLFLEKGADPLASREILRALLGKAPLFRRHDDTSADVDIIKRFVKKKSGTNGRPSYVDSVGAGEDMVAGAMPAPSGQGATSNTGGVTHPTASSSETVKAHTLEAVNLESAHLNRSHPDSGRLRRWHRHRIWR